MTPPTTLPVPVPTVAPEAAPFWEATAEGRLILPRCDDCGLAFWWPRVLCPSCHSQNLSWLEATGRGTVYSFTVTARGADEYAGIGEYVLAFVELAEGPKMLTNLVDCDPAALEIGQEVEAVFCPTGQGPALVRFRPVPH
jgi:uncharacterized OB-fold protein